MNDYVMPRVAFACKSLVHPHRYLQDPILLLCQANRTVTSQLIQVTLDCVPHLILERQTGAWRQTVEAAPAESKQRETPARQVTTWRRTVLPSNRVAKRCRYAFARCAHAARSQLPGGAWLVWRRAWCAPGTGFRRPSWRPCRGRRQRARQWAPGARQVPAKQRCLKTQLTNQHPSTTDAPSIICTVKPVIRCSWQPSIFGFSPGACVRDMIVSALTCVTAGTVVEQTKGRPGYAWLWAHWCLTLFTENARNGSKTTA